MPIGAGSPARVHWAEENQKFGYIEYDIIDRELQRMRNRASQNPVMYVGDRFVPVSELEGQGGRAVPVATEAQAQAQRSAAAASSRWLPNLYQNSKTGLVNTWNGFRDFKNWAVGQRPDVELANQLRQSSARAWTAAKAAPGNMWNSAKQAPGNLYNAGRERLSNLFASRNRPTEPPLDWRTAPAEQLWTHRRVPNFYQDNKERLVDAWGKVKSSQAVTTTQRYTGQAWDKVKGVSQSGKDRFLSLYNSGRSFKDMAVGQRFDLQLWNSLKQDSSSFWNSAKTSSGNAWNSVKSTPGNLWSAGRQRINKWFPASNPGETAPSAAGHRPNPSSSTVVGDE